MTATQRRNITIGITAGVYLFLLFEKLIHVVLPNHSHSHEPNDTTTNQNSLSANQGPVLPALTPLSCLLQGPTEVIANPNAPGDVEMKPNGSQEKEVEESIGKGICNVDSVAWMIIFANFFPARMPFCFAKRYSRVRIQKRHYGLLTNR
eukprot:sb/3473649/